MKKGLSVERDFVLVITFMSRFFHPSNEKRPPPSGFHGDDYTGDGGGTQISPRVYHSLTKLT